jgi:hypothetical protein
MPLDHLLQVEDSAGLARARSDARDDGRNREHAVSSPERPTQGDDHQEARRSGGKPPSALGRTSALYGRPGARA